MAATGTITASITQPTIGSSVFPSSSLPPPNGSTPSALLIYVLLGVMVLVVFAIVTIVIIMIGFFCYRKRIKQSRHVSDAGRVRDNNILLYANSDGPSVVANDNKLLSERTAPSFGPTGASSTQATTTNYTAVYCSERYEHLGTLWTVKLKDQIKLLSSAIDIFDALMDDYCVEIFVYMDPTDDVARELLSRGCPYNREKLKWWQFVAEDKTPDNMIEIEGYRIVQVEGDPADFNTHQLGLLKTEYPIFNKTDLDNYEDDAFISQSPFRNRSATYHVGDHAKFEKKHHSITTDHTSQHYPLITVKEYHIESNTAV